jgi:hypothetical protein
MRRGVVAHCRLTDVKVHYGVNLIAYTDRLLGCDLVGAHALDRVVAAFHVGDDGVVIVAVEPSAVADLSARLGVEGRVVEDDFAFVSRVQGLCPLAIVDYGEGLAVVGASLAVAIEVGFRKLLVGGIGG